MPNWCYNSIQIKGDLKDIKKLAEEIHGDIQPISFSKISPVPEDISEKREEKENIGGLTLHDWCCTNWGTKWDVDSPHSDVDLEVMPCGLNYTFQTAWSPALPVFQALAEKHPAVDFDYIYCDESVGFAGRVKWKNGLAVMMKEFTDADKEYDCITRGVRIEEDGIRDVGWVDDIPTALAREAFFAGEDGKVSNGDLGGNDNKENVKKRRGMSVDILQKRIEGMGNLRKTLESEVRRAGTELGFDFEIWEMAGLEFHGEGLWGGGGDGTERLEKSGHQMIVRQIPARKIRGVDVGEDQFSEPDLRIFLRPKDRRMGGSPDLCHGSIRVFSQGVELLTAGGWGIQALLNNGKTAHLIIKQGNKFQNQVSGKPAGTEWGINPSTGGVYKTSEAFCSDGRLWDPNQDQAAYTEWYPKGSKKLEARFFDGRNISKNEKGGVVFYSENGTIENIKSKALPRKTECGNLKKGSSQQDLRAR